jgi:hypothetical protein
MPDEQHPPAKGKKDLKIRDFAIADHEALERMARKLGMAREAFTRVLLHTAIWRAPALFEMELQQALGARPEDEELAENADSTNV